VDLFEGPRIDAARVRHDGLDNVAHLEAVRVALVVKDVAPGNGRLVEMPDQRLLFQRQIAEAVGIELDDGRFADALEQVRPIGRGRGSHRRRRGVLRG
jgi:hypothetical protein